MTDYRFQFTNSNNELVEGMSSGNNQDEAIADIQSRYDNIVSEIQLAAVGDFSTDFEGFIVQPLAQDRVTALDPPTPNNQSDDPSLWGIA